MLKKCYLVLSHFFVEKCGKHTCEKVGRYLRSAILTANWGDTPSTHPKHQFVFVLGIFDWRPFCVFEVSACHCNSEIISLFLLFVFICRLQKVCEEMAVAKTTCEVLRKQVEEKNEKIARWENVYSIRMLVHVWFLWLWRLLFDKQTDKHEIFHDGVALNKFELLYHESFAQILFLSFFFL